MVTIYHRALITPTGRYCMPAGTVRLSPIPSKRITNISFSEISSELPNYQIDILDIRYTIIVRLTVTVE